jgi:hypothetical protein
VLEAIEECVHFSKGLAMLGLEDFDRLDAIGKLLLKREGQKCELAWQIFYIRDYLPEYQ